MLGDEIFISPDRHVQSSHTVTLTVSLSLYFDPSLRTQNPVVHLVINILVISFMHLFIIMIIVLTIFYKINCFLVELIMFIVNIHNIWMHLWNDK